MTNFEIIKCHGSGNDFIMVDATRLKDGCTVDWSAFARIACDRATGIGSDGVLLVVRNEEGIYGMDMLLTERTGVRCTLADDPASCVVYGCGKSLAWINQMTEGPINVARKRLLNAKTR